MKILIIASLLLSWLASTATYAADRPPTAREKKVAAIKELMEVTGAEANEEALARTFSQQLVSVLQANDITLSDKAIGIIEDEVGLVVAEQLADARLQNRMYAIYERYFTLEELEGLIAFNKSPIGRKANRVMPILMRESSAAAQAWSEEIGPELSQRVMRRLSASNVDLGLDPKIK